jgi:hypothetical protein
MIYEFARMCEKLEALFVKSDKIWDKLTVKQKLDIAKARARYDVTKMVIISHNPLTVKFFKPKTSEDDDDGDIYIIGQFKSAADDNYRGNGQGGSGSGFLSVA